MPHNDNSLLLINAGMAPLKPYFTGQEIPPRRRVTTCQKCIRTGDIENVGKTARHLTFLRCSATFPLVIILSMKRSHGPGSFDKGARTGGRTDFIRRSTGRDDEAFDIWTKEVGVPAERITRFYRDPKTGECDNFWEHGAGPCGPCSEIYYDRGENTAAVSRTARSAVTVTALWKYGTTYLPSLRVMAKGGYTELSQKNIDTGMGLERLAVVMQDVDSVFDIDTMKAIRDKGL